jgi:hypothetical protein
VVGLIRCGRSPDRATSGGGFTPRTQAEPGYGYEAEPRNHCRPRQSLGWRNSFVDIAAHASTSPSGFSRAQALPGHG